MAADRNFSSKLLLDAGQKIKEKEYWLNRFAGNPTKSSFPYDFKKAIIQPGSGEKIRLSAVEFTIAEESFDRLLRLANQSDLKVYITLTAILVLLLNKHTGSKDIVLGAPVHAVDSEGTDDKGELINTVLALRSQLNDGMTFKTLLLQMGQTIFEAAEHQNYPVELVLEQLNLPGPGNRDPHLLDIVILLENIHHKGYIDSIHPLMIFSFTREEAMLAGTVEYHPRYYRKNTVERSAAHFKQLLRHALSDVDLPLHSLDMLTMEEKDQLLADFNDTRKNYAAGITLPELFRQQVEKTPHNRAILDVGDEEISYRELNEKADRLARFLRECGVTCESVVGVMMEPAIDLLVSLLAILKAGGAYLPIHPDFPLERVRYMLKDSGAKVLLVTSKTLESMPFTSLRNVEANQEIPIVTTAARPHIEAFNNLPIPDRSLIDLRNYKNKIGMASVTDCISLQTTRGCPYKCLFCHKIWSKHHVHRHAENIFQEIEYYYKNGVRNFAVIDDCFNLNHHESRRLFQLILKNKLQVQIFFPNGLRGDIMTPDYIDLMVEAGTRGINLSLETASPRLQKLIHKNLDLDKFKRVVDYIATAHSHIILEMATMHGFPSETEEEAMMTLDFIKDIRWLHFPYIHILKVFPNTEMEAFALEHGISKEDIMKSRDRAFHELPETLPFPKSFTRRYQADFLNEYFLAKERLQHVLPVQMQILNQEALAQKYDAYLPTEIKTVHDVIDFANLEGIEIPGHYQQESSVHASIFDEGAKAQTVSPHARRILFLDLSQHFSSHQMLYHVVEQPLGEICLLTYLKERFGDKIDGRIYKSGNDFDSFGELKDLIEAYQPDLIGIRTLTFFREFFHETISNLRQWGVDVPIITGGPYASSDYESILKDKNIDLAVLGEGEYTLAELVEEMLKNDFRLPRPRVLNRIKGLAYTTADFSTEDQACQVIIYDQGVGQTKPKKQRDDGDEKKPRELAANPGPVVKGSSLAYVMYTSGSTGKPKGVMVEHRQVTNCICWMQDKFHLTDKDVIAQRTDLTFDPSVWEVFWPLAIGGTVKIIGAQQRKDADFLIRLMEEDTKLTMMYCPATLVTAMTYLLNSRLNKPVLKLPWLIIGAEPISREVVKSFYSYFTGKIVNTYGPTECTINNTYYDLEREDPCPIVPIGKPVTNNQIYILSSGQQLLPLNVPGEICIAGGSVARGYINNIGKTTGNFNDNPFGEGKLYKTGDIGRWLEDGNIEIMGRMDDQVKIRGYRIEPGEIESSLLRHPSVKECVVLVKDHQEPQVEVHVCKTCGITSEYPGVDIKKGKCDICRNLGQYKKPLDNYFKTLDELEQLIREANKNKKGKYDCLLLYAGGRGSAYALYQLKDMGFNILAATYDNGYFSQSDLKNIKKITSGLGVDHIVLTHRNTDYILRESMKTARTVCRGCFHTSSSLAGEYAYKNNINVVVGATLSRGQIIENKLFMFLQQGITGVEELEKGIVNLQKNVMEIDKNIFDFIDIDVVQKGLISEKVKVVDFYRYCDITNNELIAYLNNRDPYWKSRKNYAIYSTNCPIKQLGDYGHVQARGFHFYGSATRWEKRLGHLTLENAAEDLKIRVTQKGYEKFITRIGHREDPKAVQEDNYLCAYIVVDDESVVSKLREYLAGELPDYFIPSYFVPLAEIPLLSNGKVDRRSLPRFEPKTAGDYTGPRDEIEKKLVDMWSEVLDVSPGIIGIDANFFDLGGHSLRATILTARIHKGMGAKVSLAEIFKMTTIRELAEFIKNASEEKFFSIKVAEKKEYYALSSAQKRMYILQQMDPGSIAYNGLSVMVLQGRIDLDRFKTSFIKLINRHESLRTFFESHIAEAVQRIADKVEFEIECRDLACRDHRSPAARSEISNAVNSFIRPFNLSQAPLLQVNLLKTANDQHILVIDMHHIVSDGISLDIVAQDFMALHEGKELTPLILQYRDFSEWQNKLMESGGMEAQEKYWLEVFSKKARVLDMPIDYPRPEAQEFEGDRVEFHIDNELTQQLKNMIAKRGVTLYMILLAVYNILLSRYTGQEDIVVGTPVSGRMHADLENIIGMFVNVLAMRNYPVGSKTFVEFLEEVKDNSLNAFNNQEYQYELLIDRLNLDRVAGRNSLFDTTFVVQNMEISDIEIEGLKLSPYPFVTKGTPFEQVWEILELEDKIECRVQYAKKLYKKETIENFGKHYLEILKIILQNDNVKLTDIELTSVSHHEPINKENLKEQLKDSIEFGF